jgi:hypothetical protein
VTAGESSPPSPNTAAVLIGPRLRAEIDTARGVLTAVREVGNAASFSYLSDVPVAHPTPAGDLQLGTGDVVVRTWRAGGWRLESTAGSARTRTVEDADDAGVHVLHEPTSTAEGLSSVSIRQSYLLAGDALEWTTDIANATPSPLELGEVSFPFVANNDLQSIFAGHEMVERSRDELQRIWHEDRVFQHIHVGGHASYVLLQRPSGEGLIACLVPVDDTALEVAYQVDPRTGSQWSTVFEGPYFLTVHSRAARAVGRWLGNRERQKPWLHGETSRVLAPGESLTLRFRWVLLDSVDDLRGALLSAGQVHLDAAPGFVAVIGRPVALAVSSRREPVLRAEADSVTISPPTRRGEDTWVYELRFGTPGQKPVRIAYGDRWTRALFFATRPPAELLQARARFIVERQYYSNPDDPFGRHHALLPYDDQLQAVFLDSEESWQVGGSDEYGIPVAMYLAERNAHVSRPDEIETLESYIDDFVLGRLQDVQTLDIRRGMSHVPPLPSRQPWEWSDEQARDTHRFNNYPLLANVYHSLFKVACGSVGTRRRTAEEYLALAWRTAVRGFEVGRMPDVGAPAGANLLDLLEDCRSAAPAGYQALEPHLRRFSDVAAAAAYPYGSELFIDQTAHAQVYAALERFGLPEQLRRCGVVTRTLRWGFQPAWFRYGNDLRGSVCCWYGTPQNSEVLLREFRRTGDPRLLKLGVAGLASFLTSVRTDGASHGWFTWWPDRTGFDTRSLDTDLGLHAYLRAAAAWVRTDDVFDTVGYGCRILPDVDGSLVVEPDNGVDDRVELLDLGLSVRADRVLRSVQVLAGGRGLQVTIAAADGPVELHVDGCADRHVTVTSDADVTGLDSPPGTVGLRVTSRTAGETRVDLLLAEASG